MKKALFCFAVLSFLTIGNAAAQGVRQPARPATAQPTPTPAATVAKPEPTPSAAPTANVKPAPNTFAAQYQGGLFGYSKKVKGTITYDDVNQRFVFRNQEGKEVFGLPYKTVLVVYGDSRSYRPTAATVAGAVPSIYALPAQFIRSKKRFLIVEFNDPDSDVKGTTSFRVANKELLQSVINSLGEKAELKQRGDAFYRPREDPKPVL